MNANDDSPSQGHECSGGSSQSDESPEDARFREEITHVDEAVDWAATEAVRNGRRDQVEELCEHLHDLADWIDEQWDAEGIEESRLNRSRDHEP